jgi:hypothetical protein
VTPLVRRPLARYLFNLAVHNLERCESNGLAIYYHDAAFFEFYSRALDQLVALDWLSYLQVRRHVKAVVEFDRSTNWAGYIAGVYYDTAEKNIRAAAGPLRYAALLVRYAVELRLLHEFSEDDIVKFKGPRYSRLLRIAVNRELVCCRNIDCEARHVYEIQRWLRAAG